MSTHTTEFTATGMTCNHCVMSVTRALVGVDHVTGVAVDLPTGTVTVESDAPLNAEAAITAIKTAGYEAVTK
jgi:copper chaperone CopZ